MYDRKTGLVDFVPSAEMPMRIASQLYTLGAAFVAMHYADKKPNPRSLPILKCAFFIKLHLIAFPKLQTKRNLCPGKILKEDCTTAGLATTLGLPTPSVSKYLAQVNALGISTALKRNGPQGDQWNIKEQFREIMVKMENIEVVEGSLISDAVDLHEDEWSAMEEYKKNQEVGSLDVKNQEIETAELF